MTYESKGCLKIAELDNFEHGCHGKVQTMWIDVRASGETLDDVKTAIRDFCMCEEGALEINACAEAGRIDAQVTENAEGYPPSESELELWKAGELELYAVTYSFQFEQVTRSPAVF